MKRFLMTLMIVMTTVSVAQKQEQPFFIPTLGMTAKELHSRILIEKDCPALMAQWEAIRSNEKNFSGKRHETIVLPFLAEHRQELEQCTELAKHRDVVRISNGYAWSMTITLQDEKVSSVDAIYDLGSGLGAANPAFGELTASASKAYGEPMMSTYTEQNGFGVKFDLRAAKWSFKDGGMLLISEIVVLGESGYTRPIAIRLTKEVSQPAAAIDPFAK